MANSKEFTKYVVASEDEKIRQYSLKESSKYYNSFLLDKKYQVNMSYNVKISLGSLLRDAKHVESSMVFDSLIESELDQFFKEVYRKKNKSEKEMSEETIILHMFFCYLRTKDIWNYRHKGC